MEDLEELPIARNSADVLVSEWMGYALLFESMLDSVLLARDRWLKPGGAVLPDRAVVCVAAGNALATGLDFWDDVHGFSMADVREDVHASIAKTALIAPVRSKHLMSPPAEVHAFDLTTMRREDVDFSAPFELTVTAAGPCHAVVLWFDTPFTVRFCRECPVLLSTAPSAPQTHWVQTVLVLADPLEVAEGCTLRGRLSFARSGHRSLDISLEMAAHAADGSCTSGPHTSAYVMAVSTGGK